MSNYLLKTDEITQEKMTFNVSKVPKKRWLLISLFVIITYIQWFVLFQGSTFILLFFILLFSVLTWNYIGRFTLERIVIKNFENHIKSKENNVLEFQGIIGALKKGILMALGLYLDPKKIYFVEAEVPDAEITSTRKILKTRMFDVISASLGMVVLLGSGISFLFFQLLPPKASPITPTIYTGLLFLFTATSPILVSWFIPTLWALQDSSVRSINLEERLIEDVSTSLRNGVFSRFLGLTGLLGGVSLLVSIFSRLVTSNPDSFSLNTKTGDTILIYTLAVFVLFLVILFIIGPAYFVSMLYISKFHSKRVNDLRKRLVELNLNFGLTTVQILEGSVDRSDIVDNFEDVKVDVNFSNSDDVQS